jgi:C4-dicarboxylate transporter DctQ subunit
MIVASQLVRTDGHVRPDLVLRLLPSRWQRRVEIVNCLIALSFCGLLVWFGWDIVDMAMMIDQRSPTDLQFPMWMYDAALPTGAALMFARYLQRLARFVFAYDPATMTIGHSLAHEAPLDVSLGKNGGIG